MAKDIELNVGATSVSVEANKAYKVIATLQDVDKDEVMEHFTIEDFVQYFGENKVLEAIGINAVKDYFGFDR
jgi:hypothetical protein